MEYKVGDYVLISNYDCSQSIGLILDNNIIKIRYSKKSYEQNLYDFQNSKFSKISCIVEENESYSFWTHKNINKKQIIEIFNNLNICIE